MFYFLRNLWVLLYSLYYELYWIHLYDFCMPGPCILVNMVFDPAKWMLFFKQVLYTLTFGFCFSCVPILEYMLFSHSSYQFRTLLTLQITSSPFFNVMLFFGKYLFLIYSTMHFVNNLFSTPNSDFYNIAYCRHPK